MPAKTWNRTEYGTQFKWEKAPRRAQLFRSQPIAGVASVDLGEIKEPTFQSKKKSEVNINQTMNGHVMEPALQRKKKPLAPSTTSTTQWHEDANNQEYILLGNHQKFAHNVQYVPKRPYKKGEALKETKPQKESKEVQSEQPAAIEKEPTPTTPPDAPRQRAPAPKVVVDTGAQTRSRPIKPTSASPPYKKTKVVAAEESKKLKESINLTKLEAQKENDARRLYEQQLAKEQQLMKLQLEKEKKIAKKKAKKASSEFVQTNLDRGVTDSVQAADSEYAMKYRHGIAPPRSKGPKRMSEYQLQYKWMKSVPNSPLLAADQVVYKSSTQIGPYKTEAAPKKSEYAMQFKQYEAVNEPKAASTKKLKRSKSLEDMTPDRLPPAGLNRVTSQYDPRLVQESLNPNRFSFPHGKYKSSASEYHQRFCPPANYVYEDGAWKPPTAQAEVSEPSSEQKSWFSEVQELRKKASEYRTRARGTHFSRSHLAQLYAQNAELWDTYSVVSALSLESGKSQSQASQSQTPVPGDKPQVSEAWREDDSKASTVTATARSNPISLQSEEVSESSTFVNAESEAGRLPTPKVRKRGSPYVRHHLDRTTPCSGGALLSSPPRVKVKEYKAIKGQDEMSLSTSLSSGRPSTAPAKAVSCTCGAETPDVQEELESRDEAVQRPLRVQQQAASESTPSKWVYDRQGSLINARDLDLKLDRVFSDSKPAQQNRLPDSQQSSDHVPTFGMPTRDSHYLLDEEASTDRPLTTKYVKTPQNVRLARQKFPEADVPPTIDEGGADTYNKYEEVNLDDIPQRKPDEDSFSVRSVASSCSIASEIYERARKNRDQFWGPSGTMRG